MKRFFQKIFKWFYRHFSFDYKISQYFYFKAYLYRGEYLCDSKKIVKYLIRHKIKPLKYSEITGVKEEPFEFFVGGINEQGTAYYVMPMYSGNYKWVRYKVGDTIKPGDICTIPMYDFDDILEHPELDTTIPVGFTCNTIDDCRECAKAVLLNHYDDEEE